MISYILKNSPKAIIGTGKRSSEFCKDANLMPDLNPKRPEKNLAVPNLDKMTSRHPNKYKYRRQRIDEPLNEEYQADAKSNWLINT